MSDCDIIPTILNRLDEFERRLELALNRIGLLTNSIVSLTNAINIRQSGETRIRELSATLRAVADALDHEEEFTT